MSKTIKDVLLRILYILVSAYWAVKRYLYFKNFEKKHITFGVVDGKFQITSTSHDDFIRTTQKNIDKLAKTKSRKEFIKLALSEALSGCNFIIFSCPNNENKYVQFWTGDHKLAYNFYANKFNKLKIHFLSIIGLLSEIGFVNYEVPEYRGRMVFKIDKGRDYISVDANFRNDLDLAAEFTEIVYKQIYKVKLNKLIAKVE